MAVKITQNSPTQLCGPEELSLSSYGSDRSVNFYPYRSEQLFQNSRTSDEQPESVISNRKDTNKHMEISRLTNRPNEDSKTVTPSRLLATDKNCNLPFIRRTNLDIKRVDSVITNRRSFINRTVVDKVNNKAPDKESTEINIDNVETCKSDTYDIEKQIEHMSINMPDYSSKCSFNLEVDSPKSVTQVCLTLPEGADLDQVMVGRGRFQHRQLFEKAYRVGNLIGRGGFGSVYAGVRLTDNKMVAIKHVARDKIRLWCSASGASVPKEICLMRHSHGLQNVIRLLDFYERPDSFILILSKPSCYKDLFDFITERGTLDEVLAQKFFRQILSAVRSLKSRNVVHRDIKDENILVNLKTNNCFIIDFGSGCHFDAGPLREFEGTHLYAPPEWLSTGQYSAESATVWSLGVLLYVMCQGDLPFPSEKEILNGDLRFRRQISVGARELVKECLTMHPRDRLSLEEVGDHPWVKQHISPARPIPQSRVAKKLSNC